MSMPRYFDYNATTPVDPKVADAIEPFLREHFGNPSSGQALGRRAHEAVELARARVAALICARSGEIVFTGCATEANDLAILGVARALRGRGRHLITTVVVFMFALEAVVQDRVIVTLIEDQDAVVLERGVEFGKCAPSILLGV